MKEERERKGRTVDPERVPEIQVTALRFLSLTRPGLRIVVSNQELE
jgi:hypothetical protein